MRRIVSLVIVAALVGAGVLAYLYTQSGGNAPKYRQARVERGPLTAAVSATGNLNAVVVVQVGSQVSGQIRDLLVDFNSIVKKNQVIARIDPDIFEAKVNQAKADLDSSRATVLNQEAQVERARADVDNARAALVEAKAFTAKAQVQSLDAKRDYDRKSELFGRQLIAKSDLDTAQATYDAAMAQLDSTRAREQALSSGIQSAIAQLRVTQAMLESARAQVKQKDAALRQAQVDLDHTTILAPVDGVVVSRQVDVGQTVAASLQAPILFTIAQDLTRMQVETSVDEADIGRIKLDDRATFTVDAFPGETFAGSVTQIRKAAQIVQNVVTYTVVVAVANPTGRLVPGMTANVKLVTAEKPSVLKVPNAALRFRPAGAETAAAPGAPAGGGGAASGGPSSPEQIRDRLVKELKLTEEQQKKLEPILQESREQVRALQGLPEPDRRARAQKIREATRAKIREILTDPQKARYDETASASGGEGRPGIQGRVWVLGPDGKPAAVALTLGLSDGASTEVLRGEIKEDQEVIVGLVGGAGRGGSQPSQPGAPRLRL
ncbi:MAG TPA: efflux RND transporter periplasmic adaptor subunit [Candidatus Binatia bacterium]|nr:efflux RND transporter periplasmic adaptor subunit [Candidatus Binatia bacterium]